MAFEKLYDFVDKIKAEYLKTEKHEYLFSLCIYYETTLQHAKFRSQRDYCKAAIKEMNPAYFKGYFNIKD